MTNKTCSSVTCAWAGKSSGAIGFALNFLFVLFFVSRQRKEQSLVNGVDPDGNRD